MTPMQYKNTNKNIHEPFLEAAITIFENSRMLKWLPCKCNRFAKLKNEKAK